VVQNASPFGLNVRDLDTVAVERLHLPDMIQGVLVTDVDPGRSRALAQSGPITCILEINRRRSPRRPSTAPSSPRSSRRSGGRAHLRSQQRWTGHLHAGARPAQ
jgi:hypothetical protein